MKMQNLTLVKLIVGALVATFLFAGVASAQTAYAGKFRLPQPVQWGNTVLPAGEYQFKLDRISMTPLVTVQSADHKTSLFVMPGAISDRNAKAPSALIIQVRGNQRTVRSLRLAEVGLALSFGTPEDHRGKAIQEARATQEIPVLAGK